jgi:hypothetical protein
VLYEIIVRQFGPLSGVVSRRTFSKIQNLFCIFFENRSHPKLGAVRQFCVVITSCICWGIWASLTFAHPVKTGMSINFHQSISILLPSTPCISNRHCNARALWVTPHQFALFFTCYVTLFVSTSLASCNTGRIPYNPRHLYLHSCCRKCLPPNITEKLHRR